MGSWSHIALVAPENSLRTSAYPLSSRSSQYTKVFRARHNLLLHPTQNLAPAAPEPQTRYTAVAGAQTWNPRADCVMPPANSSVLNIGLQPSR
jgi:hypothetical protein